MGYKTGKTKIPIIEDNPLKKANKGQFQKGKPGGPGRPKTNHLAQAIFDQHSPEIIQDTAEILKSKKAPMPLRIAWLNKAVASKSSVELKDNRDDGDPRYGNLTDEQLRAISQKEDEIEAIIQAGGPKAGSESPHA